MNQSIIPPSLNIPDGGKLLDEFYADVIPKLKRIAPTGYEPWYTLALGWALGKGRSPEDSCAFASHAYYHIFGGNFRF